MACDSEPTRPSTTVSSPWQLAANSCKLLLQSNGSPPKWQANEKPLQPSHCFEQHPDLSWLVRHVAGPSPNVHSRIRTSLRPNDRQNAANLPQPMHTSTFPSSPYRRWRMHACPLASIFAHAWQWQRRPRLQSFCWLRMERRTRQLRPSLDEQCHHPRSCCATSQMHRPDRDAMLDGARTATGSEKNSMDTPDG